MTKGLNRRAALLAVPVLVGAAALLIAGRVSGDLAGYTSRAEPEYAWKLREKRELPQGTVYDLEMTSQKWQGITWRHTLHVYLPKGVQPEPVLPLMNTGGTPDDRDVAFGMDAAGRMKTAFAVLYDVPNQPLLEGKTEDTLIAETFVRYLDTKDENWPLLFPMVKSVRKAMDTLQAFTEQEWKKPVKQFVVTGASKRGWTSWLTAASGDPRVKAIAPMVIDTLNMKEQMSHQRASFGAFSSQISDYTRRGLVPIPDTQDAQRLWKMVDPYTYRESLTLPKLILNGNNDPYWAVDALNLYWDGLKGDKWITYVPNAGHNLAERTAAGGTSMDRALGSLAAFVRHQVRDTSMPKVRWRHSDAGRKLHLLVVTDQKPKVARLWVARSETRDFRQARWTEQPAQVDEHRVSGEIEPPRTGFAAFYGELEYEIDGLPYYLSTQLRVAGGPPKPGQVGIGLPTPDP